MARIQRRSGGGCLSCDGRFPWFGTDWWSLPGNGTPPDESVTPLRRNAIWSMGSVRGAPSMSVRSPRYRSPDPR